MYEILRTAWMLKEITVDTITALVARGKLSQTQAGQILAEPQQV